MNTVIHDKYGRHCKFAIIGFSQSGRAVATLLEKCNIPFFISELNPSLRSTIVNFLSQCHVKTSFEVGEHTRKILEYDVIVVSPGISPENPILTEAIKNNTIMTEIDLTLLFVKKQKIIAVTGTNGKTTVTNLITNILLRANMKTLLAGNMGDVFCRYALQLHKYDFIVLELSSYQLEWMQPFSPDISMVLNLSEDHIERHKTMQKYLEQKSKIFLQQRSDQICIFNHDEQYLKMIQDTEVSKKIKFSVQEQLINGVFYHLESDTIYANIKNKPKTCFIPSKNLIGLHNISNICASIAVTYTLPKVNTAVIQESLANFSGLSYRMESMGVIDGVNYINDSKSTNEMSTLAALRSFEKNPVWIILGGKKKKSSYQMLFAYLKKRTYQHDAPIKGICLIGESTEEFNKQLQELNPICSLDLRQAMSHICRTAESADVVLFSPACASFDQYTSFVHRGDHFSSIIKTLYNNKIKRKCNASH